MNFERCFECRLLIPSHLLSPIIAIRGNEKKLVKVCEHCKGEIEKNKNEKGGLKN
jgi:hypothetical protein